MADVPPVDIAARVTDVPPLVVSEVGEIEAILGGGAVLLTGSKLPNTIFPGEFVAVWAWDAGA